MVDKVQFSWLNGAGEHVCTGFDRMVDAYWGKVAQPALAAAEQEAQDWLAATAKDVSAVFVHSDREMQYQVTALGLCLSLSALWERQLRRYLSAYVPHDPAKTQDVQMHHWGRLQEYFQQLRGVPLQAFLWYPELDLLSRLGNVCRHGNGRSADDLWRTHPEFWPYDDPDAPSVSAPPVERLHIGTELLDRLAGALVQFWSFIEFLYIENLHMKHSSVERALPELRKQYATAIAHFNRTMASRPTGFRQGTGL